MIFLDRFLEQEGPRAISPDMPSELIVDIGRCASLRRFKDELIAGWRARQNLALLRQVELGQVTRRRPWYRKAGMRVVARILPEHFHRMAHVHRRADGRPDYRVWTDPEALQDTLKRHPEMAVPETKGRTTVGWVGNDRDHRFAQPASRLREPSGLCRENSIQPQQGIELAASRNVRERKVYSEAAGITDASHNKFPAAGCGAQGNPATPGDDRGHESPAPENSRRPELSADRIAQAQEEVAATTLIWT